MWDETLCEETSCGTKPLGTKPLGLNPPRYELVMGRNLLRYFSPVHFGQTLKSFGPDFFLSVY